MYACRRRKKTTVNFQWSKRGKVGMLMIASTKNWHDAWAAAAAESTLKALYIHTYKLAECEWMNKMKKERITRYLDYYFSTYTVNGYYET